MKPIETIWEHRPTGRTGRNQRRDGRCQGATVLGFHTPGLEGHFSVAGTGCGRLGGVEAPFTQDTQRDAQSDAQRNAIKWDLLLSMGVFTLHTCNIKGFAFQFACTWHPTSCVN